jgi:hypothetical protein
MNGLEQLGLWPSHCWYANTVWPSGSRPGSGHQAYSPSASAPGSLGGGDQAVLRSNEVKER